MQNIMPVNPSVYAIFPTLKSYSTAENALPRIVNCLKEFEPGKTEKLYAEVRNFIDGFPRLPLWERFKDFFGLSNTAENQRNAIVLLMAAALQYARPTTLHLVDDADEALSACLSKFVGGDAEDEMREWTALAIASVLKECRLGTNEAINMSAMTIKSVTYSTISNLEGTLSFRFGDDKVGTSSFLSKFLNGVNLPFSVTGVLWETENDEIVAELTDTPSTNTVSLNILASFLSETSRPKAACHSARSSKNQEMVPMPQEY